MQVDSLTMSKWRETVTQQPVLASIIDTPAFQRLHNISFLGAVDYFNEHHSGSRANHSIGVAALALFVAHLRGYNKDLTLNLACAALVHDIGHTPLSHSVEPMVKSRFGFGHHQIGHSLIQGKYPLGRELHCALVNACDIDFITSLVDQQASKVDGGDLFSSRFNIDTIEGIHRSLSSLCNAERYSQLEVARSVFIPLGQSLEVTQNHLDRFWLAKHKVYSRIVNSRSGVIADQASMAFFTESPEATTLTEVDLVASEQQWQQENPALFNWFHQVDPGLPSWFGHRPVLCCDRRYEVDNTQHGSPRYIHQRELVTRYF